ncbi:unnamed protein product [Laminaria digitata]
MFSGRGRCFPKFLWQEAFRMAVYLANRVPSAALGGKTPFSMWHGGAPPSLEHLRTFGARGFVHQERYVKKLTMKAWEGRMVGYGKDSKTYRVWESGTKIVDDDGTFLELDSSSISLGTQEEMPETEADAETDTGGSQSGGILSDSDEESDSDVDSQPIEAAKANRTARQLRQLGDYNVGLEPANITASYPWTVDYACIIGHPLIDIPNTREVSFTPRNHREAMASAQASEWQASMERELASMSKYDVYELIPAPKGRKIIGSMWVFKVKPDGL